MKLKRDCYQIILVTHQRRDLVKNCIESLLVALHDSSLSLSDYQIFVGCNADGLVARELREIFVANPRIRIESWETHLSPASARNRMLALTAPGWILFLDDDICVPKDYFKVMASLSKDSYEVIGGPNLNFPESSTSEQLQEIVLGSRLMSGPFADRYSRRPSRECHGISRLILCNLWVFQAPDRPLKFNESLLSGEENDLLRRLSSRKFFYCRDLYVFHRRRENLKSFAHQAFRFGYGRGQVLQQSLANSFNDSFTDTFAGLFSLLSKAFLLALSPLIVAWILGASIFIRLRRGPRFTIREIFSYGSTLALEYFLGISSGLKLQVQRDLESFNGRVPLRSSLENK